MIEQLANAVTFLAFYTESKVGKTGLTVTIDVWEIQKDGTSTEVVAGGSATEIGDGLYRYVLASGTVDAEGEYVGVFKTATTTVDQQHLPALWSIQRAGVENLDATTSSRATAAALALVQADTDNIQTRLPAALTPQGNIKADLQAVRELVAPAQYLGYYFNSFILGETLDEILPGQVVIPCVLTAGGIDASANELVGRPVFFATVGLTDVEYAVRRIVDSSAGSITIDRSLPTAAGTGAIVTFFIPPDTLKVDIAAVDGDETAAGLLAANIGNLDAPISSVQADVTDIKTVTADLAIMGNVTQLGQTETFTTDLDGTTYADDRLERRLILFTGGPNIGAIHEISTYAGGTITVSPALTNATAGAESFVILPAGLNLSGGGGATAAEVWEYDEGERALSAAGNLAIWNVLTTAAFAVGSMARFILTQLGLITADTTIEVNAPVNAGLLTITKAVTLNTGALDVTVPAGWTKCYVTGKASKNTLDSAALFQIVESNPGVAGDGLLFLNGAAAEDEAQGSATVDEGNNQVAFSLTDNVTALMAKQNGYWDIKFLVGDGSSTRPVAGLVEVVLPVTLTI